MFTSVHNAFLHFNIKSMGDIVQKSKPWVLLSLFKGYGGRVGLGAEELNGFLDSLYIVLYPPIIHLFALKSIARELLDKNPHSGFDDPHFRAKGGGGLNLAVVKIPCICIPYSLSYI